VVEKRSEVLSKRCNGEVIRWTEIALSVASEVSVEDIECCRWKTGPLRSQKAPRLPNVASDTVLEDH
jgi:hypothetical protein